MALDARKVTPLSKSEDWRRGDSRLITPGKRALTADEVRGILDYDPETGIVRWKVKRYKSRQRPGDIAGCVTKPRGEVVIGIGSPPGNQYKAHHLAWLIMTGAWPNHTIDHIDLDPSNNRWANLREATIGEQQRYRPKLSNNTSGYKGVCFAKDTGRWQAQIRAGGGNIYLGQYDTAEEAAEVYREAARKLHGTFALY